MHRITAFLISMVCVVSTMNTAGAVTWTIGELVQMMQQARNNGQPFDSLLAEKVSDELAKAGFKIVDNRLTYSGTVDAVRIALKDIADEATSEAKEDFIKFLTENAIVGPGMGKCIYPIPEGSLIAARSAKTNIAAKFSNNGTYFNLRTTPSQVALTLKIDADITANTKVGFEWCGTVLWPYQCSKWVTNPLCPPPICIPDVCYKEVLGVKVPYPCCNWKSDCPLPDVCAVPIPSSPYTVDESWTDWAEAAIVGPLRGSIALTLNHSFDVTNNTVTIGANATIGVVSAPVDNTQLPLAAIGPVIPNTRLISVPVPPYSIPHVDKSPILQTVASQVNGRLLMATALGFDDKLVRDTFKQLSKKQQARLDNLFNDYFPLTIELPTIQNFNNLDPATQALLEMVLEYLYGNIDVIGQFALDVVKNNWTEVLYYVLTDNREALAQLFAYQALCPSIKDLKANMPVMPLYSTASGSCAPINPRSPGAGPFYATASCQTQIGYQKENFDGFCRESLTAKPNPLLGNAAAWPTTNIQVDTLSTLPDRSSKWSLSSAAQLAVGVEPIRDNHVPYMKRVQYRQADGCALEMRVYKKNIADTNLTPLLWIHGGAWTYRSSGFLGMESLVSSYTEDNFVVFAPFYRLAGDKDGNQECRNATWQKMVADVEAALDWVKSNGAAFGADDTTRIPVTGQSAGAHLAGWLITHRPADVSRALLVYPPTDLNDFLVRLRGIGGATFPPLSDGAATPYDPSSAQDIVETYLQWEPGDALTIDPQNPAVTENSFAQRVASAPQSYPPAFILHGTRDSLLTYTQAEVLCEGYGGNVNVDWSATPDLRAVYTCGDRSYLHLFKEADHAFEVCPFPNIPGACRAGSAASASLLIDSIQEGRRWLLNRDTTPGSTRDIAPLSVVDITASAYETGNPPVNASDNDLGTRWSALGNGQWIQYDLGTARNVGSVAIAWHEGDVRVARFDIQTSVDGATWQTAYAGDSSGNHRDFENVVIPAGLVRYVRIVGYGNSNNLWNSVVEVRIYSGAPPRNLVPVLTSASAYDGNDVPRKTIDNDFSTSWAANGDGQWIQYDLGASKYLTTLGLAWHRGNERQARFDIYTSIDGINWTSAILGTVSNGTTVQEQLYDFTPAVARYVRIVGHGNTANMWNNITETDIYGAD